MENHKQLIQFPCGWALFEPDSDDEATDGWCANYEGYEGQEDGMDEGQEDGMDDGQEVDEVYQGHEDQEEHNTLISDVVIYNRCFSQTKY